MQSTKMRYHVLMQAAEPKRRFQIHLSTAIVLMLWAGIVLGMNLKAAGESKMEVRNSSSVERTTVFQIGWPMAIYYQSAAEAIDEQTGKSQLRAKSSHLSLVPLLVDIAFLLLPAFLLERLIRYRAAKNHNPAEFL